MPRKKQPGAHRLQQAIESQLGEFTSPPMLFALLVEMKLRKSRVRLSADERKRLQDASKEFLETGDTAVLSRAVNRKRRIQISISPKDLPQFEKIFTKTIDTTIAKTIATLARTSEADTRDWSAQHAEQLHELHLGLQARIAKLWEKPLRRFAMFRCLSMHVGELSVARFREIGSFKTSRLANALALLHARACLIAGEIEALMRTGFADGAMARWRTLHEVAVTMSFLVEHGESTAERYLEHYAAADLKAANQYELYRRKLGERTLGRRFLNSLTAQVAALKAKYGKDFIDDYGWARPEFGNRYVNFAMIEEAVTLSQLRPYYKLASEQVHASVRGAVLRSGLIGQTPPEAEMLTGPTNYGFADAGQYAALSLLLATVSLLRVEPTIDTNVASMILARWIGSLRESFVRVQLRMEGRGRQNRRKKHIA